jgi:hypothetical protein
MCDIDPVHVSKRARRGGTRATLAIPKAEHHSQEPSESAGRKIAMVVELLCRGRLRFSEYRNAYGREFRSFHRDLHQIRKIGEHANYTISNVKNREYVDLLSLNGKKRNLSIGTERVTRLIATMAMALGEPIARELSTGAQHPTEPDDFFSFATPRLTEGTEVANICDALRGAHSSSGGRAAVRFAYPDAGGGERDRVVEPYRLTFRSGNFYLIGFDRGTRGGWRVFALDRFRSRPIKSGTCTTVRSIPPEYASDDVVGFIKGTGKRVDVTVELSSKVAEGVAARTWQAEQRLKRLDDGRVEMTFTVSDIGEVVRWALGFGVEARIVGPPVAVDRATETIRAIAHAYDVSPP